MKILLRSIEESDLPFVFSTWLKGLYHGNILFNKIDQDIFYSKYHLVLESLIKKSFVKVACLESEPDVILGYSVSDIHCLHWIFVKKAWRKLGIGKSLMPKDIVEVSHLTKLGETLMKTKHLTLKYNPFL